MRIGFDFDNTLINYYGVFFDVAYAKGLVPHNIKKDKNSVKEFLHNNGQGELFTEIQGLVYGKEILRSKPSKNVLMGLNYLLKKEKKENLFIVSHKTQYPFIGEKIDLREAASRWIEKYLKINEKIIFPKKNIFYEPTIEKKIERIKDLKCDYYFDDLPIVIEKLPSNINGFLYDPLDKYSGDNLNKISDWKIICDYLFSL